MISRKAIARMERQGRAEVSKMCRRYKIECKELGSHIETEEEKGERLAKKNARENNKWKLKP